MQIYYQGGKTTYWTFGGLCMNFVQALHNISISIVLESGFVSIWNQFLIIL